EAKLTPDEQEQFRKTFTFSNHTLYDVDPPIARKARSFRERVLAETSKVLTTPDAIHLATAAIYGAHEVHTLDDGQKQEKARYIGIVELNGKPCVDGLAIVRPSTPQAVLPGV